MPALPGWWYQEESQEGPPQHISDAGSGAADCLQRQPRHRLQVHLRSPQARPAASRGAVVQPFAFFHSAVGGRPGRAAAGDVQVLVSGPRPLADPDAAALALRPLPLPANVSQGCLGLPDAEEPCVWLYAPDPARPA